MSGEGGGNEESGEGGDGDSKRSPSAPLVWRPNPRSNLCFKCLIQGHQASGCLREAVCWRCRSTGHRSFQCKLGERATRSKMPEGSFPGNTANARGDGAGSSDNAAVRLDGRIAAEDVINRQAKVVEAPWSTSFEQNVKALRCAVLGIVKQGQVDRQDLLMALRSRWKDACQWSVSVMSSHSFLILLPDVSVKHRLLTSGFLQMNNSCIMWKEWDDKTGTKMAPRGPLHWCLIFGVPIALWSVEVFASIIAETGNVVAVDDNTSSWRNLQSTRVLVESNSQVSFPYFMKLRWCSEYYWVEIRLDTSIPNQNPSYKEVVKRSPEAIVDAVSEGCSQRLKTAELTRSACPTSIDPCDTGKLAPTPLLVTDNANRTIIAKESEFFSKQNFQNSKRVDLVTKSKNSGEVFWDDIIKDLATRIISGIQKEKTRRNRHLVHVYRRRKKIQEKGNHLLAVTCLKNLKGKEMAIVQPSEGSFEGITLSDKEAVAFQQAAGVPRVGDISAMTSSSLGARGSYHNQQEGTCFSLPEFAYAGGGSLPLTTPIVMGPVPNLQETSTVRREGSCNSTTCMAVNKQMVDPNKDGFDCPVQGTFQQNAGGSGAGVSRTHEAVALMSPSLESRGGLHYQPGKDGFGSAAVEESVTSKSSSHASANVGKVSLPPTSPILLGPVAALEDTSTVRRSGSRNSMASKAVNSQLEDRSSMHKISWGDESEGELPDVGLQEAGNQRVSANLENGSFQQDHQAE